MIYLGDVTGLEPSDARFSRWETVQKSDNKNVRFKTSQVQTKLKNTEARRKSFLLLASNSQSLVSLDVVKQQFPSGYFLLLFNIILRPFFAHLFLIQFWRRPNRLEVIFFSGFPIPTHTWLIPH